MKRAYILSLFGATGFLANSEKYIYHQSKQKVLSMFVFPHPLLRTSYSVSHRTVKTQEFLEAGNDPLVCYRQGSSRTKSEKEKESNSTEDSQNQIIHACWLGYESEECLSGVAAAGHLVRSSFPPEVRSLTTY